MPGPRSGRPPTGRIDRNAACVECHPVQARQWERSGHRVAYTRATFTRALQQEPRAFCRGCHAPEADPRRATDAGAAAIGVACVTCHVVDGEILAAPGEDTGRGHPVRREPAFAEVDACARCHEFEFEDGHRRWKPSLMQSTVSEHRRSAARTTACSGCHMPTMHDGHRDHTFAASRDPAVVRSAVDVSATRDGCTVRIELTPQELGHAFPTGDLFRRIEVRVEADDFIARRHLARHFGALRSGTGPARVEIADDRVGPGPDPRIVTLEVPRDHCRSPVRWAVEYQRVQELPGGDELAAVIDGRIMLEQGTLR